MTNEESEIEILTQGTPETNMKFMEPARDSISPDLEYLENLDLHNNDEDGYSSSVLDTNTIGINSSQAQKKSKNKQLHNTLKSAPKSVQLPKLETKLKNNLLATLEKSFSLKDNQQNKMLQFYVERAKKEDKIKLNR
ncbi:hypothetical protein O181_019604 [Austropuccinia psidii MF-1]|uniref:Uncharacterized protein n=1 Tax=Austropuccinia psidii MF-1 TaxID=1389203 RepID=A0A9Q3GUW7_9BASI|nr:hypothetical protein [Austropuccinia psidii MF-1]